MSTGNKSEIAKRMNELGKKSAPFFFCIDFDICNFEIFPLDKLDQNNIYFCFGNKSNLSIKPEIKGNLGFKSNPVMFEEYLRGYSIIEEQIHYGNSYLLNYTCSTPVETKFSLEQIFLLSSAAYRILFKNEWVVFSPECFVRIEEGKISSYPMKGTIDARIPDAGKILLSDEKELAEHHTIVDLIRNDLSCIADNVRVEKFRYIDRLETNNGPLLQMSSKISGELGKDYKNRLGDIITSMLPAGSISGAPKKKTLEIIRMAENHHRGYYTGIAGVFDGVGLDSCVLIRFIENTPTGMVFKSGGGITSMSHPQKEYEEMKAKVYLPFII